MLLKVVVVPPTEWEIILYIFLHTIESGHCGESGVETCSSSHNKTWTGIQPPVKMAETLPIKVVGVKSSYHCLQLPGKNHQRAHIWQQISTFSSKKVTKWCQLLMAEMHIELRSGTVVCRLGSLSVTTVKSSCPVRFFGS